MNDRTQRVNDADKLTDEQHKLLDRAVEANKKAQRAAARHRGGISARDDLIRSALEAGVGVSLLARELHLNRAMIWKIEGRTTTQEVERRRAAGGEET